MLFNSVEFLIFFPVVTILFFLLPHKVRWLLLLVASCIFYMFFKPEYILIIAFTIIIDYYAGILIESAQTKGLRKRYLLISLVANVGVLAIFKYYNFINDNITGFVSFFGYNNRIPGLKILLPIGLSFHTFQAMSYTIEVYRGHHKAERHFGIYSLYVMFYPQLVAGPIERPQNIMYQFHQKKYFNRDNLILGLKMMLLGFFKKIVIADRMSIYVDSVYSNPANHHGFQILLALLFFSVEIYCDFSGYTDIALGTARVMGFTLIKNFNYPYTSKSVSEFWNRWHMSLSTWFRDYVYISLGGNRVSKPRVCVNLLIVFLLSGLWHGAGWTFIVWGVIHGLAVSYEYYTKGVRSKLSNAVPAFFYKPVSTFLTFCFITFTWIFFRSYSMHDAMLIIRNSTVNLRGTFNVIGQEAYYFFILLCFILLEYLWKRKDEIKQRFNNWSNTFTALSLSYYSILFWFIVFWGVFDKKSFIYFQF